MQDNLQQLSFGNNVSLHFFHRVIGWNWISTSLFNLDSVNSAGVDIVTRRLFELLEFEQKLFLMTGTNASKIAFTKCIAVNGAYE